MSIFHMIITSLSGITPIKLKMTVDCGYTHNDTYIFDNESLLSSSRSVPIGTSATQWKMEVDIAGL